MHDLKLKVGVAVVDEDAAALLARALIAVLRGARALVRRARERPGEIVAREAARAVVHGVAGHDGGDGDEQRGGTLAPAAGCHRRGVRVDVGCVAGFVDRQVAHRATLG